MNEYEEAFRSAFVQLPSGFPGGREWDVPEVLALEDGSDVRTRYSGPKWDAYMDASHKRFLLRDEWVKKWAWAVPTDEALDAIAEVAPIVEVGCGYGYWASLLRERGVDIECFDIATIHRPGTHGKLRPYTSIARGDHRRALRMYPRRTPMLCWAPYDSKMAVETIRATDAKRIVWVGELYGCNGDDEAMELLDEEWVIEKEVHIPQYFGMHDDLLVYRRKT